MEHKMSDEELVKEFNQRTTKGCEGVYIKYHTPLTYFARRVIMDEDEAKDITSTALIDTINSLRQFEKEINLRAFLFITVKNRCLKYKDRQEVGKKYLRIVGKLEDMLAPSIEEYIEAEEVRTRFLFAIYDAIEKLPPVRRKVFEMSYIDGLKVEQITAILNMTRDAVYVNNNKAIKDIRRIVKEKLTFLFTFFIVT